MPISNVAPKGRPHSNEEMDLLIGGAEGFTTNILRLLDYSLNNPEYDEVAALKSRNWIYQGGRKRRKQTTLRGIEVLEEMYEVNMPEGYGSDPQIKAIAGTGCLRVVFLWDRCTNTFIDIRSARFDPIKRRVTPIQSAKEDGAPLSLFTKFYGVEREHLPLKYYVQSAPAKPIHTIGFKSPNCADCDTKGNQEGVYGGTDALLATTINQFGSGSAITTPVPAGHVITDHLWDGDVLYVTHADTIDPATATAGGIAKIVNGVSTAVLTITKALFSIVKGENKIYAFGEEGLIYQSINGTSFTLVTNTAMATTHFLSAAFEPETGWIYLAGHNGTDGKAGKYDGNTLVDISATLPSLTAKKLSVVKVLSTPDDDFGHVAFGGASGYIAENGDVGNVANFTATTSPITDDVKAIEGDSWRSFFGAGTNLYHRAIYTGMEVTLLQTGLPGNVLCGATGDISDGVNHIAFGISVSGTSGSIVMLRPEATNT